MSLAEINQTLSSTGRPALFFAMALFFSLMSIPMPRGWDLMDAGIKYFLAVMAAIMLYAGLHYAGLKGIPL